MKFLWSLFFSFFVLTSQAQSEIKIQYPEAPSSNVSDTFFGTIVQDPYRLLEENKNPKTILWKEEELKLTKSYFSNLPNKLKIETKLNDLLPVTTGSQVKVGKYFTKVFWEMQEKGYSIYIKDRLEDTVYWPLLMPSKINWKDNINFRKLEVSKDSKWGAFSYSRNGSDWQEIGVVNMKTGFLLKDHINDVKFSEIKWFGDGFFYAKYDSVDRNNIHQSVPFFQKIYYHLVGKEAQEDVVIFQNPKSPNDHFDIQVLPDESYAFFMDEFVNSKKADVYYINKQQPTTVLPFLKNTSNNISFIATDNGNIFALTTYPNASNGMIVEIDPKNPTKWELAIPELEDEKILESYYHKEKFYTLYQTETEQFFKIIDASSGKIKVNKLGLGNSFRMESFDEEKEQFIMSYQSYHIPIIAMTYDIKKNEFLPIKKTVTYFNPLDYEINLKKYKSKDGTEIPIYICSKKGFKRDGTAPLLLEVSGGFDILSTPDFNPGALLLLQNGGCYAFANIRGGGSVKKDWYREGALLKKQNSLDDLYYAAKYLEDEGYCSKDKIAITGGSNGGLLVAAAVNQHPEMYRVAIPQVGVYDMLRFHKFTGGQFWQNEYGNVEEEIDFKNLFSYSPIHNIKPNTVYPSMLIMTSSNDDRIPPLHSYKYLAALQSKTQRRNPILLYEQKNFGHNGAEEHFDFVESLAQFYAFLFGELGIKMKP